MRFVRNRSIMDGSNRPGQVFPATWNKARLLLRFGSTNKNPGGLTGERDRTVKFWKQCGDQEFLWLLVALIAMAVWVTNAWMSDPSPLMTVTGTVPPGS